MSEAAHVGLKYYYLQSMFNGFQATDGEFATFEGDNKTRAFKINTDDVMQPLVTPNG
jgi:hypothetical protein